MSSTITNDRPSFSLLGLTIQVAVDAESTDGAYSIIDQRAPFGGQSPLHTVRHDKVFIVAAGEFVIRRDGESIPLHPGGAVAVSAGVPHAFKCVSPQGGRLIVFTSPGGHEHFLRDLSGVARSNGKPDPDGMREVCLRHGVEMLGEPRTSAARS